MPAPGPLNSLISRYAASVERRSRMLVERLPRLVEAALPWWIAIFMVIAVAKIARSLTPVHDIFQFMHRSRFNLR